MRLFIAFEIPEHIKERLTCLMEELKPICNDARWVKRDELHITAAFFGETDPYLVPAIADLLQDVACVSKCQTLHITGLGAFPSTNRASVLWAGIEHRPELFTIVKTIRNTLSGLEPPISFDSKPFKPHITLARFKVQKNIDAVFQKQFEPILLSITTLTLYETVWIHGGGHRYEKRAQIALPSH